LKVTPSNDYVRRTEWNARDSDGTVVISVGETLSGGSRKTVELARKHGRLVLHLSKTMGISTAGEALRRFVREQGIRTLNVAGPRALKEPEIGACVRAVLDTAWPPR
jgi:hypothetical protein